MYLQGLQIITKSTGNSTAHAQHQHSFIRCAHTASTQHQHRTYTQLRNFQQIPGFPFSGLCGCSSPPHFTCLVALLLAAHADCAFLREMVSLWPFLSEFHAPCVIFRQFHAPDGSAPPIPRPRRPYSQNSIPFVAFFLEFHAPQYRRQSPIQWARTTSTP